MTRIAHAIGTQMSRRVDARDDLTAGTHAERVPPRRTLFGTTNQPVIRRAETRGFRASSVSPCIDQCLGMFDPHAKLRCTRFDLDAVAQEMFPRVPGTVSNGEYHRVARHLTVVCLYARDRARAAALVKAQPRHLRVPVKLNACIDETLSQRGQNGVQAIRPDMGAGIENDLRLCTARNERLKDGVRKRMIHPRVELAVRIRTGAAFSEQEIVLGVRFAAVQKTCESTSARPQFTASFNQIHRNAALRQYQCCEQACWPCANNDDPLGALGDVGRGKLQLLRRRQWPHSAGTRCAVESFSGRHAFYDDVDMNDEAKVSSASACAPCVQRPACNSQISQMFASNPDRFTCALAKRRLGLVETECEICHAKGVRLRRYRFIHAGEAITQPAAAPSWFCMKLGLRGR